MIEINKISKSFHKKRVLQDISLHVDAGEIICLLGPSGAGKTTLIRLITGALKADAGDITIDEIKVPSMKLYTQMGFMPQNDALYIDLTGLNNLLFFGGLYGLKKNVLKERTHELLALLDLEDDQNKLVANYSGGMKKRLSLAVALLHKPKVLLLDEPTVGIDPLLRRTIWEQFYEQSRSGVSIIVTTHVMDEAVKCHRTALIYNGSLVACDTPKNLLAKTSQGHTATGSTSGSLEDLFFMAKEAQL
ncbi:MAG: ABC transporter ATP-binding protein [Peptococcaceae bacterium]|nr:ABC transporter ATP-binding protein [Peptococcaceae bacterium]